MQKMDMKEHEGMDMDKSNMNMKKMLFGEDKLPKIALDE
jgi:hypothetical protein